MPIDMSLASTKAPPRKAAGTSSAKGRVAPVQSNTETRTLNERRADGLMGLASLVQGVCLMTGQYADAAAVGTHFQPVAKELANIADGSDAVAKPIDFLIEIGPYGALVSALMPLTLQVMANHNMIDASRLMGQGVVPPAVLEAQMQAQVAGMQMQAMVAQKQAVEEAQKVRAEYEQMMSADKAA